MPPNSRFTFEICVDSPAAITAAAPFADRIELCAGLDIGGLTPDVGLMEFACEVGIETHILIRARSGDFEMTPDDVATSVGTICVARQMGLKGVVIGAARGGALDRVALEAMIDAADGMDVTLHRVIDIVDDPIMALELAVELGADRILTSGGAPKAVNGLEGLNNLYAAAAGRIDVMAGGGINSRNITQLTSQTKLRAFHASCSTMLPLDTRYAAFGFGKMRRCFDEKEAKKLARHLHLQKHDQ